MKQKKRLTRQQKRVAFKTVKKWLAAKDKARRQEEAEEFGKLDVGYNIPPDT